MLLLNSKIALSEDHSNGNGLLKDYSQLIRPANEMNNSGIEEATYCAGYLNATIDTHEWVSFLMNRNEKDKTYSPVLWCLPKSGVTTEQVARIFVKFLQDILKTFTGMGLYCYQQH